MEQVKLKEEKLLLYFSKLPQSQRIDLTFDTNAVKKSQLARGQKNTLLLMCPLFDTGVAKG